MTTHLNNGQVICTECGHSYEAPHRAGSLCPADGAVLLTPPWLGESQKDPMLGTIISGSYAIFARLGRGAMGNVYKARHNRLDRLVAIKTIRMDVIQPDEVQEITGRFLREARALSNIKHDSIITVYDYGEHEQKLFMVLEYVNGQNLWQVLKEQGRLPVARVVPIMKMLGDAVSVCHKAGIVHRDLKPSNVMLERRDGTDRVVLIDFGIAKADKDDDRIGDVPLTQMGALVGTPKYMAPEQLTNGDIGPWSDLYALGVLSYRLLSGVTPFLGSRAEVVAAHLRDKPPALPSELELTAFDPVIARAMAKHPSERHNDAGELVSELIDAWVATSGTEAVKTTQPVPVFSGPPLVDSTIEFTDSDEPNATISIDESPLDYTDFAHELVTQQNEESHSSWRGAVERPLTDTRGAPVKPRLLGRFIMSAIVVAALTSFWFSSSHEPAPPERVVVAASGAPDRTRAKPNPNIKAGTLSTNAPTLVPDKQSTKPDSNETVASPVEANGKKDLAKRKPAGQSKSTAPSEQKQAGTPVPKAGEGKPKTDKQAMKAKPGRPNGKQRAQNRAEKRKNDRPKRRASRGKKAGSQSRAAKSTTSATEHRYVSRLKALITRCNCDAAKTLLAKLNKSGITVPRATQERYKLRCGIIGLGCLEREEP